MWIQMPADVAARKIASAIFARKRERVVTGHGYWIVFIERHFPWLLDALIRTFGIKARLHRD